jgi:hypothetical protein
MRIAILDNGHSFTRKLILLLSRIMMGVKPPDVIKTLLYRGEFFGDHHSAWTNQVLRGSSEWTIGERELFAAFTSKLNQCVF